MKAVKHTDAGISVVDVDEPAPVPEVGDGVLVHVRSSSICSSDLHMLAYGPQPFTLGHEFAGVLDDGTPVAVDPGNQCGVCALCTGGLRHLCHEIQSVIQTHRPSCLAVEETFYHKNVKSALALGQARGAALLAAAECDLEVVELSAKTVKQAAVGTGAAAKEQVAAMITALLGLPERPASQDACDAAAVALAALHRRALPEAVRP